MATPDTVRGSTQAGAQEQSTVEQAKEKVQETAQGAKEQARGRVQQQLDARSTQAGEQVSSVADALRRTGEQLRSEENEAPARVLDGMAERAERLGRYLEEADSERFLQDVEGFARRRPWAVVAGAVALGFVASRFLKASSSRRYESSETGG